jgi:hypothetical protein
MYVMSYYEKKKLYPTILVFKGFSSSDSRDSDGKRRRLEQEECSLVLVYKDGRTYTSKLSKHTATKILNYI